MKIKIIILGIAIFINFILLQLNVFRGILEIIVIAISIYFGITLTKNKFGKAGRVVEQSAPSKYPEEFMKQK
jgi:hypothetical protein